MVSGRNTMFDLALASEVRHLNAALTHIATMDCYTRPGEEMPHILMKRIAEAALANEETPAVVTDRA